ncbi:hypothetical protein [Acinetobacter indicus]|uniref:Uncharacterized protein n=1 Tax=Acinetobacter indicus CIP 110367 TaxID=1341679 RepID=V2U3F9_9GAMM|nr:hypothetical protein [Acinetobacter indicus]EPF70894.1 hypothetical protein F956_02448 [Acinetobacter indicus ANC 4215]ESK44041.1 hypothetical protein P253_03101 [Acinetobacter indicus CIP 110367]
MSAVNLINENDDEREIASQAACALRESFIIAAQSGSVMYVENDHLMSKTPNRTPIVIKRLEGQNPDLARRFAGHGTFKIKKRKVSQD